MDLGLTGKRVFVQGSSQGLGYAIAAEFAREGAHVALCSRNAERLKAAHDSMGAKAFVVADLAREGESRRACEEAAAKLGGSIDVVVCNTGGPPKGPFLELGLDAWREGYQSLWLSVVESLQATLPAMKTNGWGRALVVTSAAAKEPMNLLTISNGLRAGLSGLIKTVNNEMAPYGITLNALLPGYTDTERLKELKIPAEAITAQIPARRLGRPEELGALATFLGSDRAGYISGQMIACDGGYLKGH